MVESGEYFVINRPRQYGKTTTLFSIEKKLSSSETYIPIQMNLQGIDEQWHQSDRDFAQMFFNQFSHSILSQQADLSSFLQEEKQHISDMGSLSVFITKLVHQTGKKLVLLIDEVDASAKYEPFIKFLGMLRTKYLDRFSPRQATFHSVVLAGVHDIKNLKYKFKTPDENKYLSPWNIAADFKVSMSFTATEIASMLKDYSETKQVVMDIPLISRQLYYHTSGHPFLVSKLCKIIAEDISTHQTDKRWSKEDVETAVQLLLKETNTNFDSLIKNLENNQALYDLVYRLILEGDVIPFNQYNSEIRQGVLYGIFKNNGQLKIHNRIYEQLIYEYMTSNALTHLKSKEIYSGHFLSENNKLDMKAVLQKFQQFMKEEYSHKNKGFVEQHGRLIFLAFLAPILNGQGYSFKEVQTSLEKRLDVIITYLEHRYIIELKRWYGDKAHQKGLDQLADYLDIHGVTEGFLIIFDDRKDKNWAVQTIRHQAKSIFAVWV